MIDKHPRLIVRCADVSDVIATVNFARDNGCLLAVRCGGTAARIRDCDGGSVLDCRLMKGLSGRSDSHTVRVDGGCHTTGSETTAPRVRLVRPVGIFSTTGIGAAHSRGGTAI